MSRSHATRRKFIAQTAALAGAASISGGRATAQDDLPDVERPGKTRRTPFAVNIEMWFRGSFEERIAQAAKLGYPAIEFWPHHNKNIEAGAELLRQHEMTATQFTAWGFGTKLNNPDHGPQEFVDAIGKACEVAAKLPGCEMFTVVVGNNIKGLSKEQMFEAAAAKLREARPVLEQNEKMIILEPMNPYNHANHCFYGSKDGIALCKMADSPWVKLNWDLFHMQRFEGNLIDNLRKGKDYVGYLQLADSPARNEPGTGEVNYTNVFEAIREIGYTLPVGLECSPQGGDVVRAAKRIYAADV